MLFDHLLHADWSARAGKRWQAVATKANGRWRVTAPVRVSSSAALLGYAFASASSGRRVLLGFDFPIGLPLAYAVKTGFENFRTALTAFGEGRWSCFFKLANDPSDLAVERPFYPRTPMKGVTRSTVVSGLHVSTFLDLLRQCERKTDQRGAACSLFWTLGGNQVGRAAIAGWREIIRPAIERGAKLWPFDGRLADLSRTSNVVVAETYPSEAYHHVGIMFKRGQSKRRQVDRASKSKAIFEWADRYKVALTDDARATVSDGFGSVKTGEDAFDAFAGLLGMIEVVDGRRGEGPIDRPDLQLWEGWILGQ